MLRRNQEIPQIQQISLLDSCTEACFRQNFSKWFKSKSEEYVDKTLKDYCVGEYRRDIPRILLYPLSKTAFQNYFPQDKLYRKHATDPAVIGFKEAGYQNNAFIRDLSPNDVCLFLSSDGKRCKRKEFISRIKDRNLPLYRLTGYKIAKPIFDKRIHPSGLDVYYWPDEVKTNKLIYPYICKLEEQPFIEKRALPFPYIKNYSEATWEAFRSCIQFGEYREISPLDFTLLLSNL